MHLGVLIVRHICSFTLVILFFVSNVSFATRLKDISHIKGVRDNQLMGYGLVIGLNGTGDGKSKFTGDSMAHLMKNLGVKVNSENLSLGNIAAVVVTATLPPFAKIGRKIDVKISAIGASSSLSGGTLLMTPLKGADNQIYLVAQGSVSLGGDEAAAKHPTVGIIANGGIVEKDFKPTFLNKRNLEFILNENDFTTVARVARAINSFLGGKYASTVDNSSVNVIVPYNYTGSVVQLIASLENIKVNVDMRAKIVVNERTGTIVMGENVKISPVAIAHGNLTIKVRGKKAQAQAPMLIEEDAIGKREVAAKKPPVNKPGDRLLFLEEGASVSDVVKGLNAIGASPADLIPVLQAIKAVGAIHADLELL